MMLEVTAIVIKRIGSRTDPLGIPPNIPVNGEEAEPAKHVDVLVKKMRLEPM